MSDFIIKEIDYAIAHTPIGDIDVTDSFLTNSDAKPVEYLDYDSPQPWEKEKALEKFNIYERYGKPLEVSELSLQTELGKIKIKPLDKTQCLINLKEVLNCRSLMITHPIHFSLEGDIGEVVVDISKKEDKDGSN